MMDVTGAIVVGLASAPIWILAAILTRVLLGGSVIFRQARGGIGGSQFDLIKFRTMTQERDENGRLLPDHLRTHWWGSLLRRTSIDELPSLINILRGEMSLVGPRPLLAVYLGRFSERDAQRHRVLPGLTGLAQISGRNAMAWEDRFELDLEYIDSLSLKNDLKILWNTVKAVLASSGSDGATESEIYAGSDGTHTEGQE